MLGLVVAFTADKVVAYVITMAGGCAMLRMIFAFRRNR